MSHHFSLEEGAKGYDMTARTANRCVLGGYIVAPASKMADRGHVSLARAG